MSPSLHRENRACSGHIPAPPLSPRCRSCGARPGSRRAVSAVVGAVRGAVSARAATFRTPSWTHRRPFRRLHDASPRADGPAEPAESIVRARERPSLLLCGRRCPEQAAAAAHQHSLLHTSQLPSHIFAAAAAALAPPSALLPRASCPWTSPGPPPPPRRPRRARLRSTAPTASASTRATAPGCSPPAASSSSVRAGGSREPPSLRLRARRGPDGRGAGASHRTEADADATPSPLSTKTAPLCQ